MSEQDLLQHTDNAGEKAVSRTEELLSHIASSLDNLTTGFGEMASHLSKLELQQAAERVPETARVAVDDGVDTAGAAGNVVAKSVDVPLAVSEDVIHDAGSTVKAADSEVKKTRKKLFKSKRRG